MASGLFESAYRGRCGHCRCQWEVGEPVGYDDDGNLVCEPCHVELVGNTDYDYDY